ncbi:MFS transporter [Glycomyces algeriensis]|uniref:MFS transporter n=1 Tax=Glycomyces algeriensis TaxID=256037 RepID=A0A9W6GA69_9ACTN|nr:MFS transporter [Glycomyces algeriensis]MDA1364455.1 MFS transporter [Glycomyces algeriensis]MDR7350488.1 putative MFS family arabinose efflux permease [Glycomyces algeriensis]GLI43195.1 MFS transporter [Glycomyces algeriensis]
MSILSDFDRRSVAALLALATAAFCYVTVETVPVGLLSEIAADLDVSPSRVGLLVTGYSITVAVLTLPLVRLVANVPRRPLLLALMAVLVAATALSAAAPTYELLFAARVATALSQAVFWGIVAPVAAGMFPAHVRGRVMAVVFTGGSIGPMLGVPAGTWLGQAADWQTAFLAFAGLGMISLLTLVLALPAKPTRNEHAGRGTTPDARQFALVLVTSSLAVAGFFAAFTYTSTFVTVVAGMSAALLGPLLLARGLADFGGIAAGGALSDRNQRLAVILPVGLLSAAMLAMFALGTSPWAAAATIVVTGLAMGALIPALQNRVMEFAPGSTDTASAGNSIAFNIGIALGSSLGGLTLTQAGPRGTALTGAGLALAALVFAVSMKASSRIEAAPAPDRAGAGER